MCGWTTTYVRRLVPRVQSWTKRRQDCMTQSDEVHHLEKERPPLPEEHTESVWGTLSLVAVEINDHSTTQLTEKKQELRY